MGYVRFIHTSDVHLGREQYGLRERFEDFGRAFAHVVDTAIAEAVDFVLVAGDFFDKHQITPATLLQTSTILDRLREAGIPIVVVEGNHDKAFYSDDVSWLRYLNEQGLLILLRPEFRNGRALVEPWTPERRRGVYVEMKGVRIYGLGFLGGAGSAAMKLDLIGRGMLPHDLFTIALLHATIGGGIDVGRIREEDLTPIWGKVDYLALGHRHRRFELGGWAFNGGALETCDIAEADYGDEKGFYLVHVEDKKLDGVEYRPSRRRGAFRFRIDIAGARGEAEVLSRVEAGIDWQAVQSCEKPILEVLLRGRADLSAVGLDPFRIVKLVHARHPCLKVLITPEVDLTRPPASSPMAGTARERIEGEVIEALIREEGQFLDRKVELAELVLRFKAAILAGEEGQAMDLIEAFVDGEQRKADGEDR